jgi:N-methylhydantoinase A/oxoprolinase/acetone carboxylase beta subunit
LASEAEYRLRYGHINELSAIETLELEVTVERILPLPEIAETDRSLGHTSQIASYFDLDSGPVTSAVIPRGSLRIGDTFAGPTVIYEQGATTVIPPGATGVVVEGGSLLIDVRNVGAASA